MKEEIDSFQTGLEENFQEKRFEKMIATGKKVCLILAVLVVAYGLLR